ncbi:MAG: PaaI family thioesterase [Actinomycetota bacterium]|nr:PaaI family thioesterase [Actinomycetota bacterium]
MADENDLEQIKQNIFGLLNNSPFYLHLGMEVVDAGEGRSRLRLPVKDEFKNLYGILHGGVVAALLDSSCTIAVGSLLDTDEAAVTVDQRINYISNVSGGVLHGEGRALHKGRYTGVAEAQVRDDEGNLVAVGMATIFVIRGGESQVRDSRDPVDKAIKLDA